jgi:hypothetical protein
LTGTNGPPICAHGAAASRQIEAKIGDDAAHAAHPRFDALFIGVERSDLPPLDLFQRLLQPDKHIVDALDFRKMIRWRTRGDGGARLKLRLPIRRGHKDHRVTDRRRLWRTCRFLRRRAACARLDRSRDIGHGAQRGGARLKRRLPALELFELLVELFLV